MKDKWECFGADDKCWRCGEMFNEEIRRQSHHLIPRSEEGDKVSNNLAWLCPNCHAVIHQTKMKAIGYRGIRPSKSKSSSAGLIQQFYQSQAGHPPAKCPRCGIIGGVTGVTEFSKSLCIDLVCYNCGHKFVARFR